MDKEFNINIGSLWDRIQTQLKSHGIEVDLGDEIDLTKGNFNPKVKVVCVSPDLKESVDAMGQTAREHAVMARVDTATLETLDDWVATGAVKSRSEAAALFIREGLKVRADELSSLRDALREVQDAQEKLHQRAREIFGQDSDG
ncbi:MAG: hypothetical protein AAF560_03175 [Acidobacteriota bacterium]